MFYPINREYLHGAILFSSGKKLAALTKENRNNILSHCEISFYYVHKLIVCTATVKKPKKAA